MLTIAILPVIIRLLKEYYFHKGGDFLSCFIDILCSFILPVLLIFSGLIFSVRYRLFFILHPQKTLKTALSSKSGGLRSLSVALAGTLGVGNIVGVSSAIMYGGAGSLFWMWVSAILAMSIKYCEVFLAMKYRRSTNGTFVGGAPYYINDGLSKAVGKRFAYVFSMIFAILCIINSLSTGNLVQVNSVSSLLPVSPFCFGIVFATVALIVVIGKNERISKLTSILIPALSVFYVALCLFILITNLESLPDVIADIFKEAFSKKSVACGFLGYGFMSSLRYGISRGILSNEAGCGTACAAHASSNEKSPHTQGCLGIFEVFLDTIVLCSLTGFVILLSGRPQENAMSLVLDAFYRYLGDFGAYSVSIACILFAFATVCAQFFYARESISYLTASSFAQVIFTVIFVGVIIVGAIIPMELMWQISDLVIATLTITNLFALWLLFNETKK